MDNLKKIITAMYGEKGTAWLAELPMKVDRFARLWGLHDLKPFANLTYNYVLSGFQNAKPIVLKLGLDSTSLEREANALDAFSGRGAVAVLERHSEALLLQRAAPGNLLRDHLPQGKPEALQIACKVAEKLHRAPLPKEGLFPSIKDWLADFSKKWALPQTHLARAKRLKDQLLQRPGPLVLLHGDLHRGNILFNGDEWLVIDPKGVIGSPIQELWAFVEAPQTDLPYIATYFQLPWEAVVKWYYLQLLSGACWQVEDKQDPTRFLDLAQSVLPLIQE